jgi:hypothetical protein
MKINIEDKQKHWKQDLRRKYLKYLFLLIMSELQNYSFLKISLKIFINSFELEQVKNR